MVIIFHPFFKKTSRSHLNDTNTTIDAIHFPLAFEFLSTITNTVHSARIGNPTVELKKYDFLFFSIIQHCKEEVEATLGYNYLIVRHNFRLKSPQES